MISSLCEIAPVYLSLGNHEIEYQDNFGTDVTQLYQAAGAIVLEHQYRDITVKGQSLRIGGIYGYCLPDKYLETEEADLSECMFLWDFENTDRYKILLSHLPIAWLKNDALEEWNMDCVFSGHLHGGQVILPGIGGVYAPDMGWFPGRLKGVFDSKDGKRHLVLSAWILYRKEDGEKTCTWIRAANVTVRWEPVNRNLIWAYCFTGSAGSLTCRRSCIIITMFTKMKG